MNAFVGALLASQVCVGVYQAASRVSLYHEALNEADRRGKPLLVVGGPYGNGAIRRAFHLKAHGFGDVCTDIDPRACKGAPQVVTADITDLPFEDKEFGAVFVGHVFNHLGPAERAMAWQEVTRVADTVYHSEQSSLWLLGRIFPNL